MVQLVINGITYNFPEQNDSPPWGQEITSWSQAVTNALETLVGSGDILLTTATIVNNQSSPANVLGLTFDPTQVRSSIVEYSVYRSTNSNEAVEVGTMYLSYKSLAGTWDIVVVGGQGAGMTFSITNAGQVQYTSTNITGTSYSGVIKFKARSFLQ